MKYYMNLLLCLLLSLFTSSIRGFPHTVFNGYEVHDLRTTNLASFTEEAKSWKMVGLIGSTFATTCSSSSDTSLGGYNILASGGYFEKTFTSLPPHDMIYFRMRLVLLDKWQSPDTIIVQADGRSVTAGAISSSGFPSNVCGGSSNDQWNANFMGKIAHTGNSVTFRVISAINRAPNVASFSFRRFMLSFVNKTVGETETSCLTVGSSVTTKPCGCDEGYYLSSTNKCLACDKSCSTCFGPSSRQCYSCNFNDGYSFNGTLCMECASNCESCFGPGPFQCLTCLSSYWYGWNYTCSSTCSPSGSQLVIGAINVCKVPCSSSQFLNLWNSTCSSSCNSPLIQSSDTFGRYCSWPCSASQYLYWNNSCLSTCNSPFIPVMGSGNTNQCKLPCSSGQYLYQNGSCKASCPSPMISQTANSISYCNVPCNSGQYFYQNGSCGTTCSSPFVSKLSNSITYCNSPCSTDKYFYQDGSCRAVCSVPMILQTINSINYCNPPCASGQYLYQNRSCKTTCSSPFVSEVSDSIAYCNLPCSSSQYLYQNGSCSPNCSSPFIPKTVDSTPYCNPPCNSGEYLYQNGSCELACSPPFAAQTTDSITYCNPLCSLGQYSYQNGSCLPTCSSPFISQTDSSISYCNPPCGAGEYLYQNGSCEISCSPPFAAQTIDSITYCNPQCSPEQYFYQNGSCLPTCSSPFVSNTIDSILHCDSPCDSGEYLYQNESCETACLSPFVSQIIDSIVYCDPPCSPGEYFYQNGSCLLTCSFPFISQTGDSMLYCNPLCDSGQYLYQNKSCDSACPSPFVSQIMDSIAYCDPPCSSGQYFYQNESCLTTCSSPFVSQTIDSISCCNPPCDVGEYLYQNQSCFSTCSNPYLRRTYSSIDICQTPCQASEFLNDTDGSCNSICNQLQTTDPESGAKVCTSYCNNSLLYYYPDSDTCNLTCAPTYTAINSPYRRCVITFRPLDQGSDDFAKLAALFTQIGSGTVSVGSVMTYLMRGPSAGVFNLNGFMKMLTYMRYLQINYPKRLLTVLNSVNGTFLSLSFGFPMPSGIQRHFVQHPLPAKFGDYGFDSSFLINYWPILTSMILVLALITLLSILLSLTKKKPSLHQLISRLSIIIKWNFFLMVFCTNFDGITISSSLEFKTFSVGSAARLCSLIICLAVNIAAIVNFYFIFYIIRDLRNTHHKQTSEQLPSSAQSNGWKKFQIYYKGSQTTSFAQHIFMLPYLVRFYLFYSIVGFLYYYPLLQTILIFCLSGSFLFYMVAKKPFVSRLVKYQCLTDESFLLCINGLVFGLALLDHLGIQNKRIRSGLGDMVIVLNIILNVLDNIYLIGYLYNSTKDTIHAIKTQKAHGFVACLLILLSPFESGGMDLEITSAEKKKNSDEVKKDKQANIIKVHPEPSNSIINDTDQIRRSKDRSKLYLGLDQSSLYMSSDSGKIPDKSLVPQSRFSPKIFDIIENSNSSRSFVSKIDHQNRNFGDFLQGNESVHNEQILRSNDASLNQDSTYKDGSASRDQFKSGSFKNPAFPTQPTFAFGSLGKKLPQISYTSQEKTRLRLYSKLQALKKSQIIPINSNSILED